MEAGAVAVAEEHEGAGALLEHEGEVLGAHDRRHVGIDVAADFAGGVGGLLGLFDVVHGGRVIPAVLDFEAGAVGAADAAADLAHTPFDQLLHFGQKGAHAAAVYDAARDHVVRVAAVDAGHGHHGVLERVDVAGHDRLQGEHDLGGDRDRIHA